MVTLQNAENALKSVYLGTVTDLLNTRVNPLLSKIEQTSSDVWGKEIRTAAKFGINGGVGAGDEDGDLPAAFGNNYLQFVTTLKTCTVKSKFRTKLFARLRTGAARLPTF